MNGSKFAWRCVLMTMGVLAALARPALSAQDQADALTDEIIREAAGSARFIVLVGEENGPRAMRLAERGPFLVQVLLRDTRRQGDFRERARQAGYEGRVSFITWIDSPRLPFVDNLVNVLVAAGGTPVSGEEIMRVLAPGGAAYIEKNGTFEKAPKPRPAVMDAWTHPRHDAGGNAVANTAIDIPSQIRWLAGPVWPLSSRKGSVRAFVSAANRNFYYTDGRPLGPEARSPRRMSIVARDAFNGLLLWEKAWQSHFPDLLQAIVPMVAVDDAVYAMIHDELVSLNAATGETRKVFRKIDTSVKSHSVYGMNFADGHLIFHDATALEAYNAATGERAWRHEFAASQPLIGEGKVFVVATRERQFSVTAVELKTGRIAWQVTDLPFNKRGTVMNFCRDGLLGLTVGGNLVVLSAADGKKRWEYAYDGASGDFFAYERIVMHAGGSLWVPSKDLWASLNPQTGAVQRMVKGTTRIACNKGLATERFLIMPRMGMDYIAVEKGEAVSMGPNFPLRGNCHFGYLVANDLLYGLPVNCRCTGGSSLSSFAALGPGAINAAETGNRLIEGPGFGKTDPQTTKSTANGPQSQDWPTYRHDSKRSAKASTSVPARLKLEWEKSIVEQMVDPTLWEGPTANAPLLGDWGTDGVAYTSLSAPVMAQGRIYVAVPHAHRIVALDAVTGAVAWSFTADARVDTPPTIHEGLCIFGGRDGWIYAVKADDGTMAWRYRAAPNPQNIMAYGQVESPWPVHGSVLVHNNAVFGASGHVRGAQGGLHVHAIELMTGRAIWSKPAGPHNDLLLTDGHLIYLQRQSFDPKTGEPGRAKGATLFADQGFLNNYWTRRPQAMRKNMCLKNDGRDVTGHLLAVDEQVTYAVHGGKLPGGYHTIVEDKSVHAFKPGQKEPLWSIADHPTHQVEAIVLAGDILFAAGPVDHVKREKGFLWAISASDGRIVERYELEAPPVYEGVIAAHGRLYVTLANGKLACWGPAD